MSQDEDCRSSLHASTTNYWDGMSVIMSAFSSTEYGVATITFELTWMSKVPTHECGFYGSLPNEM